MHIEIYTKADCTYCAAVKRLLHKRGLVYDEVDLGRAPALAGELEQRTGQKTTPLVFIDGEHVGGFDELVELDQDGKLNGPGAE